MPSADIGVILERISGLTGRLEELRADVDKLREEVGDLKVVQAGMVVKLGSIGLVGGSLVGAVVSYLFSLLIGGK